MVRIKRGNVARKRRQKILRHAKGFNGAHSRLFRVANAQVMKSLKYAYRGRKERKRQFRQLWIVRINGFLKHNDSEISYSKFISQLKQKQILLNRKMLSHLAVTDAATFNKLLD